jgi:asparagine synthetase B (glutamine-hydrolysing)
MREVSHRWVITFNGEIYNHAELRAELETRVQFCTRSDTEVLINVVVRAGEAGLSLGCAESTHLRCGRFGRQLPRGIVIKRLTGNDMHVHA